MPNHTKININHILKFYGFYFNIWKHKLNLLFKSEKLWPFVNGMKAKPMIDMVA